MMWIVSIISGLMGSRAGRLIASVGLALAGVGIFALRIFMAGQANVRAKQTEQSLKNLRNRVKSDETIRKMPSSDVRDKLASDWMRHD